MTAEAMRRDAYFESSDCRKMMLAHRVFASSRDSRLRMYVFIFLFVSMLTSQFASKRNLGYPMWEHLLSSQGIFDDFYGARDERTTDYYLQSPLYGTNPPGTLMLGRLYALFPDRSAIVVAAVGWVLLTAWAVGLVARRNAAVWFVMVSYPFWFAVLRGNDDVYLLAGVLLLAWSFDNDKSEIFGIVVGVLALAEPYTLLFSIPLLVAGYLRQAMIPFALFVGGWISTATFGARDFGLYLRLAGDSPKTYLRNMVFGDGGMLWGNSMFGLLKVVTQNFADLSPDETVEYSRRLYAYYQPVVWVIIAVVIMVSSFRGTTRHKFLLSLALLTCLLPPVVATYKLSLLSGLLIYRVYQLKNQSTREVIETWLLVLIVTPKSYIMLYLPSGAFLTLDSILNPILMVVLLVMTLSPGQQSAASRIAITPNNTLRKFISGVD